MGELFFLWPTPEIFTKVGEAEADECLRKPASDFYGKREQRKMSEGREKCSKITVGAEHPMRTLVTNFKFTYHSINKPLPADTFDVRFREWLRVVDLSTGQVTIMGPDAQPRMTFASAKGDLAWFVPRMKLPEGVK